MVLLHLVFIPWSLSDMNFLLRITGPDSKQVFPIPQQTVTIGRESARDLALPHPLVSRLHAQLECSENECQITDMGSANGTLVGGEMLTPKVPRILSPGDKILIGPFEILFVLEGEEPVPVSEEPKEKPSQADLTIGPPVREGEIPVHLSKGQEKRKDKDKDKIPPSRPPSPPDLPPAGPEGEEEGPPTEPPLLDGSYMPPGLSRRSQRLIEYLPGFFHTDFMSRFLALFESMLIPIEWNVDNFDLFLDPSTSPSAFLPWLANWFENVFDDSWNEQKRRTFLKDAHTIYAQRGTRRALMRVLEIYTGQAPEIIDQGHGLEPHTFLINFPFRSTHLKRELIEKIIDSNKPAHTTYTLNFKD